MKQGNWIPVDRRLVSLLPHNREYTFLEAYISYRVDLEDNKEYSINGYAKMWGWSRKKVRHFIEGLRDGEGHIVGTQHGCLGQEIRLIFNESKGQSRVQARDSQGYKQGTVKSEQLQIDADTKGTSKGQSRVQARDSQGYTTIKPNPNINLLPLCEAWKSFVEMRKSNKSKPFTPRAAKLIVTELLKLEEKGFDPIDVLNQSVMRGWLGVFPLKDNQGEVKQCPTKERQPSWL